MRNKLCFIVCILLLFSGCLRVPFVGKSRYLSYQIEDGTRQAEVAVSIERLWRAAVYQFRDLELIESDYEKKYIKAFKGELIFEFTAKSRTRKNSAFTLKAYKLDTLEPNNTEARVLARKIFKKARSIKLSIKKMISKDDMR